jgi:hypothetical protein
MIIVNFTHPLTEQQRAQVEQLTQQPIEAVRDVLCHFDNQRPFAEQVSERVDAADLSSASWQQAPILINPPAFAPAAAILIAELHGRMGYFPALIRMRPIPGSSPTQFEVGEIINLQAVRDEARTRRLQSD